MHVLQRPVEITNQLGRWTDESGLAGMLQSHVCSSFQAQELLQPGIQSMSDHLFSPIQLGTLDLPNRIAVAPMCQYSADDGCASDWHLQHWMNLAMSGAGMVTVEMTDVERRGRISHGCLGLYSEANAAAAKRALNAAKRVATPGTKFGIQLAHAGRKASCQRPWEGGQPLSASEDAWTVVSASAIPMPKATLFRRRLTRPASQCSSRTLAGRQNAQLEWVLISSNCTRPTVICCINSFRPCPTAALTNGADHLRTACAFHSPSHGGSARPLPS